MVEARTFESETGTEHVLARAEGDEPFELYAFCGYSREGEEVPGREEHNIDDLCGRCSSQVPSDDGDDEEEDTDEE